MIRILFSSILCVTPAAAPSTPLGRREKSQQSEEATRVIHGLHPFIGPHAYIHSPLTAQERPLYYESPRLHVVHPDEHFDSLFDALLGVNEESPFQGRFATKQHPKQPTVTRRDTGPPLPVKRTTSEPLPHSVDPMTLPDQSVNDPMDMHQRKNPTKSVFGRLLSVTVKFFLCVVCVCFVLSFLYSLYKRSAYTKIDEYGTAVGGEGWRGVLLEFQITLRRVLLYVWRLNPLRAQSDEPYGTGGPAHPSMTYDRKDRMRHDNVFGVN
ncbi:bystin [Perkinsela sp. CCAP 1560/4]|nr:bystin [Perkinsela sp. CCAP 1560/4]|eukprot:KNH06379.1 bystin [Perkinsela sp. CCAP 1560/4]